MTSKDELELLAAWCTPQPAHSSATVAGLVEVGGGGGVAAAAASSTASSVPGTTTGTLHGTASAFLDALSLPSVHPHCSSVGVAEADAVNATAAFEAFNTGTTAADTLVGMGEGAGGLSESAVTAYHQAAPALMAMGELWLRLFAFYLAPLCVCRLLLIPSFFGDRGTTTTRKLKSTSTSLALTSAVGLASSAVLLTDELYVYEFGWRYGASLFGLTVVLVAWRAMEALSRSSSSGPSSSSSSSGDDKSANHFGGIGDNHHRLIRRLCWATSVGTVLYVSHFFLVGGGLGSHDVPPTTVSPGLYFDETNPRISSILGHFPRLSREYETRGGGGGGDDELLPTPWLVTGDSRTGVPFLVNESPPRPPYHRRWVPVPPSPATSAFPEDESEQRRLELREAVALDVAFPTTTAAGGAFFRHSEDRPIYLVLHGLNGGSDEEYVKELVWRLTDAGSTVAVMVARGLMDTPVVGKNLFHGARISDVDAAAAALRRAAGPHQVIAGVGFSMGAIIVSNYVARSGAQCRLDTAVAVSGGLDMREQLTFRRGMRLWQPMLAQTLRDIVLEKFRHRYEERLTPEQFLALLRAPDVTSIDEQAVVTYNGFDDIVHYYSEMSAMGDHVRFDGSAEEVGRIANVSVPFLVVQALDDPLVTWRTIGGDPTDVVRSGSGNIVMLLTKSGGHVGWPLGVNPRVAGWTWMHTAVADFVNSVNAANVRK